MAEPQHLLIIGGTQGLGLEIARHYVGRGAEVTVAGRDQAKAERAEAELGHGTKTLCIDLSHPHTLADALASVGRVDGLVITAIERDENTARNYDHIRAAELATLKLVGYTETIHCLLDRFPEEGASVVLFGGLAKDRPYPGSTTVSSVNGAVSTMVHTLACELPPHRFNAIHPGIVGDSPYWKDKTAALEAVKARTPGGRMVTMKDIVGAVVFLLENEGVNGENLRIDRGWMVM